MGTRDELPDRRLATAGHGGAWLPRLERWSGPIYLAIADAIAADLRSGRLSAGERLPTQRDLAKRLGINFTTVTRAYDEARRRGLLSARAGSGTFVRSEVAEEPAPALAPTPEPGPLSVDLSLREPPESELVASALRHTLAELQSGDTIRHLMHYQRQGGSDEDRAAGIRWLGRQVSELTPDRITLTAGGQHATCILLAAIAGPGALVLTEPLGARGLRPLANLLGIHLRSVAMDDHGLLPDAFADACRTAPQPPAALCCIPTLHNPTTATIPLNRRLAIAEIARQHGVALIENDSFGPLAVSPPPPFAAIAPDISFHIGSLSKVLAPGLRIAYVASPDARRAAELSVACRATAVMPPPLSAAVAARWIIDGTADRLLHAIRQEIAARYAIASAALPGADMLATPESYNLWLRLPSRWPKAEFIAHAMRKGISIESSDGFAIDGQAPNAVRLSLSGPSNRSRLRYALLTLAGLIEQQPAVSGAWSL